MAPARYRQWAGAVVCLGLLLTAGATGWAEDIPAFDYAYGHPPVQALRGITYPQNCEPPPVAADAFHLYIGGSQVNVFSRDGDWQGFWPFSSPARGLGAVFPDCWGEVVSQVTDVALGPSGDLHLLDGGYGAVQRYSPEGEFLGGFTVGPATCPPLMAEAIAASPDGSLFVLTGYVGAIMRLTEGGLVLGEWQMPDGLGCLGIAAAAPAGVWALRERWDPPDPDQTTTEVVYYGPDGAEGMSWGEPGARALETDSAGNVYLLRPRSDSVAGYEIVCYDSLGRARNLLPLQMGDHPGDFAVTPEGTVLVFGWAGNVQHFCRQTYVISEYDWQGNVLLRLGDGQDRVSRGTLLAPSRAIVGPDGQSYVMGGCGTGSGDCDHGPVYVVRFSAAGELADVIETASYPFYNWVTGEVELLPDPTNMVMADGTTHAWVCAELGAALWAPVPGTESVQWQGPIHICAPAHGINETRLVSGPTVPGEAPCCTPVAVSQEPGGTFVVGLYAFWQPEAGLAWGGVFDADWNLLASWQAAVPPSQWWVSSVTRDVAGSFYFAGEGSISKFSSSGEYLGEIGEWSGAEGRTGSLMLWSSAVHVDGSGRMRVLDGEAGHMVVFTYRPGPFPDVAWYHWAKDAVQAAVDAGIVEACPDGTYQPSGVVSRDQMAVYISRALAGGDGNVPPGPSVNTFPDVPTDHWAFRYVEYAVASRIATGYPSGSYRPARQTDRAQMAVFVARAVAAGDDSVPPGPDTPTFPDVPADHWAYRHVEYCYAQGVVEGYWNGYRPDEVVNRAQMAVYVQRAFGLAM